MSEETELPKLAFTLDETARVLGVSRPTINRLIRSGGLRACGLGRRTVRNSQEAILDLLRSHERQGDDGKTVKRFVRRGVPAD